MEHNTILEKRPNECYLYDMQIPRSKRNTKAMNRIMREAFTEVMDNIVRNGRNGTQGCMYVIGKGMKHCYKTFDPCCCNNSVIRLRHEENRRKTSLECIDNSTFCKVKRLRFTVVPVDETYSTSFMRLGSFENWSCNSVSSTQLVNAGFFCVNASSETCKCFSCGIIIVASKLEGKAPLVVHRELSPTCEYIRQLHPISPPSLRPEQPAGLNDSTSDGNLVHRFQNGLNILQQDSLTTRENRNTGISTDNASTGFCHIDAMHGYRNRNSQNVDSSNDVDNAPTHIQVNIIAIKDVVKQNYSELLIISIDFDTYHHKTLKHTHTHTHI